MNAHKAAVRIILGFSLRIPMIYGFVDIDTGENSIFISVFVPSV